MAARLLQRHDVSDLCIGKPALKWLPPSSTVADALAELKRFGGHGADAALAVWDGEGNVAGKVCMIDVLLFLCAESNLAYPAGALDAAVSDLLAAGSPPIRRVEPDASVLDAADAFLEGAHSLVVPIRSQKREASREGGELCWLTVEDLVRFFLGSIALFSPTASLSVSALGVVRPAAIAVAAGDPALSAVPLLRAALAAHTSVAVLSGGCPRRLAGEISPSTLASCDESVAAAVAALSAGDLMAFIHCGGAPPHATLNAVRSRLRRRSLLGMLDLLDSGDFSSAPSCSSSCSSASSSSSSSDDEDAKNYPAARTGSCARRCRSYSARMGRRAEEAIVCHRGSSLVAVMVQAIAHRVTYAWVVDEERELVGVVGFVDVLRVLREHLVHPPN